MKNSSHSNPNSEICIICLDSIGTTNIKTLSCLHKFHSNCIDQWTQEHQHCPLCLQPIGVVATCSVISVSPIQSNDLRLLYTTPLTTSNVILVLNLLSRVVYRV